MGAAWSGPVEVFAGEGGTWTAISYAARHPLAACRWYVNSIQVAYPSCTLNYTFSTPQTNELLEVEVTDARSVTAMGSNYVLVRTPDCSPPECYEQYRVPAPAKRPSHPLVRRP